MAHLDSKHTLNVHLSGYQPIASNVTFNSVYPIQGNTVVTFVLSSIQNSLADGSGGFRGVEVRFTEAGENVFYPAKFNTTTFDTLELPFTTLQNTYFSSVSTLSSLSASFSILYNQIDSSVGPLTAFHKVHFLTTPDNTVDRNLELLNTQLFTELNDPVPIMNFETDENIIYPMSYFQAETAGPDPQGIFLNTDPESAVVYPTDTFFSATQLKTSISGLSTFGTIALSGGGFTVQGRTNRRYSFAFSISGDDTIYSANSSISSNAYINYATITFGNLLSTTPSNTIYSNVLSTIKTSVESLGIVGTNLEFESVTTPSLSTILFNHGNFLPPAATYYIHPTVTLSGIHESNLYGAWYDPVDGIIDYLYTYPESGYGLSASNRISTDPDGDNITAI